MTNQELYNEYQQVKEYVTWDEYQNWVAALIEMYAEQTEKLYFSKELLIQNTYFGAKEYLNKTTWADKIDGQEVIKATDGGYYVIYNGVVYGVAKSWIRTAQEE